MEQPAVRSVAPPDETLLDVEGLQIHFRNRGGVVKAVDEIDFSVARRETLGLVGESGSGKTLTSLALLRLVPPPARIVGGRIGFEGEDLLGKTEPAMQSVRGRRMAMVFQNPAFSLNPIYSIGAQLGEIVRWHEKLSAKAAADRVADLLTLVGISDAGARLRQFPHELSGGMKQRVCIARALLCRPSLVLADEPTTNLDVTIQAQILDLLNELKDRLGTSMILVSHDMGVVARMADRITVMYAGRICETADARTIFTRPQHPYTRALLESMPRADQSYTRGSRPRLATIAGRPPNLAAPPTGCRFHPRCKEAGAECTRLRPELTPIAPGHAVSCLKRGSLGKEAA
ncbi:ABC transporter ATP-binding protein [Marinivivus vitaminiproducens]|uniref:ABC transporter ATP-binding protein n=1 Tax=Marinivivus vitaminiproducens TaxID=3035935 RepID=UPI0027AB889B|nr:ABC transporter ATP-binding protein [Geminicoccaceae bacterium SCSIO 64248]